MAPLERSPRNLGEWMKKPTSLILYKFMKEVDRADQYHPKKNHKMEQKIELWLIVMLYSIPFKCTSYRTQDRD
jgi:hypothetical protein